MIDFKVKGAIFDVDETLLDNRPDQLGQRLHERSRLATIRELGRRHDIASLVNFSIQDNLEAFLSAPAHTAQSALWNSLWMAGVVDNYEMNADDPLLIEGMTLKDELYIELLRREGEEVTGASAFVRGLADSGLGDSLAIASMGKRSHIDIFLEKTALTGFFPGERIKSFETATHPKPHPEVFDQAFRSLGLSEADRVNVCAFEDDPRGIMSAKAAGLYTCAITTCHPKEKLAALEVAPDFIAESYEEFAAHFGFAI